MKAMAPPIMPAGLTPDDWRLSRRRQTDGSTDIELQYFCSSGWRVYCLWNDVSDDLATSRAQQMLMEKQNGGVL